MTVDPRLLEALALRTLWAIAVAALTWLIARGLRRATLAALDRGRTHSHAALLVGNLARWTVVLLGVLAIVGIYSGEAFAWVLGSLGVLGLVAGLALQDLLKNVFAGIWVLVEQPIRIGELIEVAGYTGTVDEVAFRVTRLRRADGHLILVPNATLMTATIVNLSRRRVAAEPTAPPDRGPREG